MTTVSGFLGRGAALMASEMACISRNVFSTWCMGGREAGAGDVRPRSGGARRQRQIAAGSWAGRLVATLSTGVLTSNSGLGKSRASTFRALEAVRRAPRPAACCSCAPLRAAEKPCRRCWLAELPATAAELHTAAACILSACPGHRNKHRRGASDCQVTAKGEWASTVAHQPAERNCPCSERAGFARLSHRRCRSSSVKLSITDPAAACLPSLRRTAPHAASLGVLGPCTLCSGVPQPV